MQGSKINIDGRHPSELAVSLERHRIGRHEGVPRPLVKVGIRPLARARTLRPVPPLPLLVVVPIVDIGIDIHFREAFAAWVAVDVRREKDALALVGAGLECHRRTEDMLVSLHVPGEDPVDLAVIQIGEKSDEPGGAVSDAGSPADVLVKSRGGGGRPLRHLRLVALSAWLSAKSNTHTIAPMIIRILGIPMNRIILRRMLSLMDSRQVCPETQDSCR